MSCVIYGIKNCDTMKKARQWLADQGIECRFHDYRADGIDDSLVERLASALGYQTLINTRGTTWRGLPEALRNDLNRDTALRLMRDNPAIIKRPVLEYRGEYHVGFKPELYKEIFHS